MQARYGSDLAVGLADGPTRLAAVRRNLCSAIHAATLGVGTGRISSDATLVSMTSMRAAQEKPGGSRIGPRGGTSSSTAATGREALAGERREVLRTGANTVYRIAQDDAYLFLHRTVMLGGAHAQARLHINCAA